MRKILIICALVSMTLTTLMAQTPNPARVPARKGIIERTLPNGYVLQTTLHGDEWKHWSETADGYRIRESEDGYYYYVQKNEKTQTRYAAHNESDRTKCENRFLKRKGVKGAPQWK